MHFSANLVELRTGNRLRSVLTMILPHLTTQSQFRASPATPFGHIWAVKGAPNSGHNCEESLNSDAKPDTKCWGGNP
jgi:hypothetical protein